MDGTALFSIATCSPIGVKDLALHHHLVKLIDQYEDFQWHQFSFLESFGLLGVLQLGVLQIGIQKTVYSAGDLLLPHSLCERAHVIHLIAATDPSQVDD